jgi:hypothetical protein
MRFATFAAATRRTSVTAPERAGALPIGDVERRERLGPLLAGKTGRAIDENE